MKSLWSACVSLSGLSARIWRWSQQSGLYFDRMDGIRKEGNTHSRVSFMLKDPAESRRRNRSPEMDLTGENRKSAVGRSPALHPAAPPTHSGRAGCRVPRAEDAAFGSLRMKSHSRLPTRARDATAGYSRRTRRPAPLALLLLKPQSQMTTWKPSLRTR